MHYGFGRPQYYLSEHQLILYSRYAYGEWIQTFATLMWTKVSICLFLMRIPATKALIRPLQGAVVFLVLTNIILTILWIAQCRPVAAAWDTTLQPSLCVSRGELLRIIIAQASKPPPTQLPRNGGTAKRHPSHLGRIRLRICVLPHSDLMEGPAEA